MIDMSLREYYAILRAIFPSLNTEIWAAPNIVQVGVWLEFEDAQLDLNQMIEMAILWLLNSNQLGNSM